MNARSELAEWELLEARHLRGEPLTAAELSRHASLAINLARVEREQQAIFALRTWLDSDTEESGARDGFLARVLAQARVRTEPRLRLVQPGDAAARVPSPDREVRVPSALSSRPWNLALGASLAAGVCVFLAWHALREEGLAPSLTAGGHSSRAEIVMASGEVSVNGQDVAVGTQVLSQGTRIVTGLGTACLSIDPEVELCLGQHTEAELSSVRWPEVTLLVLGGRVVSRLSKRAEGQHFSLLGGGLRATARGTAFALTTPAIGARSASGQGAQVTVLEGVVDVADDSETVSVEAHSLAERGGRGISRRAISRAEEGAYWGLLAAGQWERSKELGVLSVESGSELLRGVRVDDSGTLILPLQVLLPAGRHRLQAGEGRSQEFEIIAGERHPVVLSAEDFRPPTEQGLGLLEEPATERGLGDRVNEASASRSSGKLASQSPNSPSSAGEQLKKARALIKEGKRNAALSAYRQLREGYPSSPEAATVLITVAQLELQVGDAHRALAAYEQYLHAGGSLAPEALAGKVTALRRLGRLKAAEHASREYLKDYPQGIHAASLRERLK